MSPIDECEVNFCSFGYELRECDLGFLFAKVYEGSETGFRKIAKPYSLPAGSLSGIDQNVAFATNFVQCPADEQGRNSIAEADLKTHDRLLVDDQLLELFLR